MHPYNKTMFLGVDTHQIKQYTDTKSRLELHTGIYVYCSTTQILYYSTTLLLLLQSCWPSVPSRHD